MSNPYYKRKDQPFATWLNNLKVEATSYSDELGVDAAVLDAFFAASATFNTDLADSISMRQAAEIATSQKDAARKAATDLVRPYVKQWQANPAIPESVKNALDLPPTGTRGIPTNPTQPLEFVATPSSTGSVAFKWKRNGNNQRTAFIIEKLVGTAWVTVDTTFKTRVSVSGFAPGVEETFRVVARRNNVNSLPSNVQTIYATSYYLSSDEVSSAA